MSNRSQLASASMSHADSAAFDPILSPLHASSTENDADPPVADLTQATERVAVNLLFANARNGEVITVGVSLALAIVQWPMVGTFRAAIWFGLMCAITIARALLRRHFEQSALTSSRAPSYWRRAFTLGAISTGLGWGLAAVLLMPTADFAQSFVVVLVAAGMISAAVPYLAPVPLVFYLYALSAGVPVLLRFCMQGDRLHLSAALLMLVYLAGICRSAQIFGRALGQAHAEESQTNALLSTLVKARTANLQEALQAMKATREQLDTALLAGRLAWFEVDIESREVRLSHHWSLMLGGPAVDTVTTMRDLMTLTHPEDRAAITNAYRRSLRGQSDGYLVDHRVRDAQGNWMWIESRARVTARRPNGTTLKMAGTNCDISNRKDNEARLVHQAYHDPLTGLANRTFLRDRLQEMIYRADRLQRTVAVLCLDLDHFKYINDSDGHAAGDQLLRLAAERLTQCVRHADVVARLGGDEFAVVLDGPLTPEGIASAAQKILARINDTIRVGERDFAISTSIGISCYPADGSTADELMTRADIAMYSAKEAGRNNFRFFTSKLNTELQEKALLMAGLTNAIANHELSLVYQPRVDCRTGVVVSVEALLRWRHPTMGEISPDRFIPLAEQTGIILNLGEWVLRTACKQMRAWLTHGIQIRHVAVNLSMRQLLQDYLVERIAAILHEYDLKPSNLEVEITESMAMQAPDTVINTLTALHRLGVRIALDDFGTGYSSLTHLKRFPIDDLKIDRSFISGVPLDTEDSAIARAILALARSLGLTAIAEGVETTVQRQFLLDEGCHDMQGYLYGRPMPPQDLRLFA